jgi:hypothetical protein
LVVTWPAADAEPEAPFVPVASTALPCMTWIFKPVLPVTSVTAVPEPLLEPVVDPFTEPAEFVAPVAAAEPLTFVLVFELP